MANHHDTSIPSSSLGFDTIARVEEVVTDILAMDLLHSSVDFLRTVLGVAGEPAESAIVAIRRSVADTSMGETDIELIVEGSNGRCGILIENKIRAPLMDRQFARYRMRGEDGISKGKWRRFSIILLSPQTYFASLGAEHSQHIDANLTYELIVQFLADHPEHAFKRHVFQSAIADSKRGYTQLPDFAMMTFYQNYWSLASSEFPQLRMLEPGIVGRDSSWILFPPLYGNGSRVRLIHKFKSIGCELAITTPHPEKIAEQLGPMLEDDMVTRITKSAAYINLRAPSLDHLRPFYCIREGAIDGLRQLERLRVFAMKDEVRRRILALI